MSAQTSHLKAQGQTLKQCGVLLPKPVFTHGQLYVCASRSSSARGLRFWLGDSIDGHGYHDNAETGEANPHTLNIVFPAVLSTITIPDAQEVASDPPVPSATSAQGSDEGAEASEFVELSRAEQHSLHETLHKSYETAPAENGAVDEDLDAQTCAPVPCDFLRRAEHLGLTRSVWAEISQRSLQAIKHSCKLHSKQ